ncbi:MAG: 2-phospho-L-lactate transferase [Acidobacteria bacterium]|nr:2-phospho-L-lactate transferase [Acidobacteriota bacterium]
MITVLAGGVGAAKFLEGLAAAMPPERITVIVNTGDDAEFHGLHVSPDIDTVIYTLAGVVNREQGWGLAGDIYYCLEALGRLGAETWFRLGDRDLATHLRRTQRLREGATLSAATEELRQALGRAGKILPNIFPMTDAPASTRLRTTAGALSFQEYFVKLRQEPEVLEADFSAAAASQPAPGVLEAIQQAESVIIAPSNPILSIGPILAVPGVREALRTTNATVAAISPIVGGRALKGPADRILRSMGLEASPVAVAALYRDFLDVLVLDVQDAARAEEVAKLGIRAEVTDTIMSTPDAARRLAQVTLAALRKQSWSKARTGG